MSNIAKHYGWKYYGQSRPEFAATTGEGEESVWDYPRPPKLIRDTRIISVHAGQTQLAHTGRALKLMETASPPTFYLPPEHVNTAVLVRMTNKSYCEWKGEACYFALATQLTVALAWCYVQPKQGYQALKGHFCFYPSKVQCFINEEAVTPQKSDFYGGWITKEIKGPFKGDPGTSGW